MYTTKILIEVEVATQFGPRDAIDIATHALEVPAFTAVTVVAATTDFPSRPFLFDRNAQALVSLPLKVR